MQRILIQRSYAHSLEQLASLDYFSPDQIKFIDKNLVKQLKDIAFDVSERKCKNPMGQIIWIGTALVKKNFSRLVQ